MKQRWLIPADSVSHVVFAAESTLSLPDIVLQLYLEAKVRMLCRHTQSLPQTVYNLSNG